RGKQYSHRVVMPGITIDQDFGLAHLPCPCSAPRLLRLAPHRSYRASRQADQVNQSIANAGKDLAAREPASLLHTIVTHPLPEFIDCILLAAVNNPYVGAAASFPQGHCVGRPPPTRSVGIAEAERAFFRADSSSSRDRQLLACVARYFCATDFPV